MVERQMTIDAPIERVFQVISDFESYPEFLSTTKSVKVLKPGNEPEVEFKVSVIKDIRYVLRFNLNKPSGLSWEFVEGEMMRDNKGGWSLRALDDATTEATYRVDVLFGWMVPKKIVEMLTETQLPGLMESFKKRSEGVD